MKPVSGKTFAKAHERQGWQLLRINGSHHVYGRASSAIRISVPIHSNSDLKPGLQRHFMKVAGLTDDDF